jgi:hypothetical protein
VPTLGPFLPLADPGLAALLGTEAPIG